jgi:hypothetical protein
METAMPRTRPLATNSVFARLIALSCAAGLPLPAYAVERRSHAREYHDHEFREHEFRDPRFLDSRYNHDHYYPPVGHQFRVLPPSYIAAVHGGIRFYYSVGIWLRPCREGFDVVTPPPCIVIPMLSPDFTQVWVGRFPYYYANNVYYMQCAEGYVVV